MRYSDADIETLFATTSSAWERGALQVMASRHFPFWRVALTYAFSGELSRPLGESVLRERIAHACDVLSGTGAVPDVPVTEMLRRLKRESGYLESTRLSDGTYEYRVTAAARRAFAAVDELSSDGSGDLSGPRMRMILDQVGVVERAFAGDVGKRVAMIDERIAELEAEKRHVVEFGIEPLSEHEMEAQLENLRRVMRTLPVDVQGVAQRLREDGIAFRDSARTSASERLSGFDRSSFELLRMSQQGRSYMDAMRVLGSGEASEVCERLEALEDALPSARRGLVSGAWDDLMRSVEHVEETNRGNVEMLSGYVAAMSTSRGRRRSALISDAISAVEDGCELVARWSASLVGSKPKLMSHDRSGASLADGRASAVPGSPDVERMRELETYRVADVLSAILEANPDVTGDVFLCDLFDALPKVRRRLVEWAGLVSALSEFGFVESGMACWQLVDVGGVERTWVAPDLFGDVSGIRDFVLRHKV